MLRVRGTLRLAWLLLGIVVGWWPGLARADDSDRYGVVTLDLRPDSGEVPTHLCVVSEAESARTRDRLWDVLDSVPDRIGDSAQPTLSWRVKSQVWGGTTASSDAQRCTDDPAGDCRPRVELPKGLSRQSDLYVACTADSLSEGGTPTEPRPLFILLEYLEGAPPQVESVRLAGGVATIGVFGASFERVIVTARSLGGHYLPHQRSQRGEADPLRNGSDGQGPKTKTVQLELTSRCRTVEVKFPRTRIKPSDRDRLTVRVHGAPVDTTNCVSNLSGREVIQVRFPPAPLRVGSVDVELAATAEQAGARFGGDYEGTWPPEPFALEFNQVTFSWRRPECIYPKDKCPSATLETGTTCASTVTENGCDYRCPGTVGDEGAIGLELPMKVMFEKEDPTQRWEDTLAQNGQELTSYVPADEVYLSANINDWRTDIPDNRIYGVDLYGESGEAKSYGVTRIDRLLLRVPGASCEAIRFRPRGDREYDELVATVDDGELDFGNPQRAARILSFNATLAVGGGPAWSGELEQTPIYFSGLGMFAVQFRPRARNWNRLAFEFRTGLTIGSWAKTVTDTPPDEQEDPAAMRNDPIDGPTEEAAAGEVSEEERRLVWGRVLFEPGVVVSLHERVQMGTGFGLGFSLPLTRDEDLTNKSLNFIWSPEVDFRFRLRRWLRLVLQFRGVFGEKAFSREGDAPIEGETARSLLFLVGLQASF